MKRLLRFSAAGMLAFLLGISFMTFPAGAQILIGPSGSGIRTFNQLPTVADGWSGGSYGSTAGGFTTAATLDSHVITNAAAALVSTALSSSANLPPSTSAQPRWNSAGLYLQSKPTGNDYLLLMARLRNDTGSNVTHVTVSYDWDQKMSNPVNEDIPGHRAFYSFTGLPGSWTLIPEFSIFTTTSMAQTLSATLPVGFWTNGASLYLLWADDNGPGATTDPQEGAYTIDNFSVVAIPATVPKIVAQPQSQNVAPGESVSFAVSVAGAPPLFYRWRKDGLEIANATNQTLTLLNAQTGNAGNYSVLVTNAFGSTVSSNAALVVGCFGPVAIMTQPQSQTLTAGASVALNVSATGTLPLTYQWRRNGVPLAGATNATFTLTNVQNTDSGYYSALVSNCAGGSVSSNAVISIASAPVVLLGLTNHFWKYDQSGTDLGTAWRALLYDDGLWPSGRGIFAREDLAQIVLLTNTPLSLVNPGPAQIITYYFRTHFSFTGELTGIQLVSSNYFDDGAVVYLNGNEAWRYNLPGGSVSYLTLASAANPGGEGVFLVSNLPPALLVTGDNVLAVEVHQNSGTSSDVAFGMQLTLLPAPPSPLQFTNQPASAVIMEGHSVTFSGAVSGSIAYFQWFKNGVPIPGAVAPALTISNAAPTDAGLYTLQASNIFGAVLSSAATLTVQLDQSAPVLLSADMLDATHLSLIFSEPVLPLTATNVSHYKITNTFGGQSTVLVATLTNQTNVLLSVGPMSAGANYIATALNIADTAPGQNALPVNVAPIARLVPLVSLGSSWDYLDPFPPFEDPDPGPGWRDPGYDLTFWGQGQGAFRLSIDESLVSPAPVGTALSQTPTRSAFFRHPFSALGFSPGELRLTLRYAVNDGAVFYLNGTEMFRDNLPGGLILPSTPAAMSRVNTATFTTLEISPTLLRASSNLLAVELHQIIEADTQKYFAAELFARAESLLVGPLRVLTGPSDTTVVENQPVTFRVSSVAANAFQWQVNGGNVFGATNSSFTFPASIVFDGAQVRCIVSQSGTSITTSNATLHVAPDTGRPVLLGAHANTDGTITLSFSEPLAAASAENILNYAVTNSTGPSATVASAVLTNGTNVVLSFTSSLGGRYTVVVSGVTDLANTPNAVLPGSAALVGASYFIPMDSAWKYLLINTNEAVQAAYMQVSYNDSTWLGPSNALFYQEAAALAGPKNTPLPLTDPIDVFSRINTYYFRQTFLASVLTSNATARVSHLIDDGMVLYLNGREIYRYNMPGGIITAASQAQLNTEATLVGPVEIFNLTNLLARTNVLAVEVHQQGINSGDVVMGVEFGIEIVGGVLPLSPGDARLTLTPAGGQFLIAWGEPGYVLEGSANVNGPWTIVAASSPVLVSPTNAAAFYRLRR